MLEDSSERIETQLKNMQHWTMKHKKSRKHPNAGKLTNVINCCPRLIYFLHLSFQFFLCYAVVDLIFDGVLRSVCSAFAVLVVKVVSCL